MQQPGYKEKPEFETNLDLILEKICNGSVGISLVDILSVLSPHKPVGYLPLSTLKELYPELNLEQLKSYFESKGMEVIIDERDFWVYNPTSLQTYLNDNEKVLQDHGWTIDITDFMKKVTSGLISWNDNPDIYALIAVAFANYSNPFFTDSFNGMPEYLENRLINYSQSDLNNLVIQAIPAGMKDAKPRQEFAQKTIAYLREFI
jgi:hypothetical protein